MIKVMNSLVELPKHVDKFKLVVTLEHGDADRTTTKEIFGKEAYIQEILDVLGEYVVALLPFKMHNSLNWYEGLPDRKHDLVIGVVGFDQIYEGTLAHFHALRLTYFDYDGVEHNVQFTMCGKIFETEVSEYSLRR